MHQGEELEKPLEAPSSPNDSRVRDGAPRSVTPGQIASVFAREGLCLAPLGPAQASLLHFRLRGQEVCAQPVCSASGNWPYILLI